ncbi:MAG: type I restriction-modification system subunit M [Erysipelothrix sp.]|nr:type I restriction-modification system subunit M [Erysipelothrix sp.]
MAIKKSDLYSWLWKSCDELRGGMDASQYKDYILVLLFMRYVTDKYYGKKDALIVVPEGGSFHDLSALKGNKEIGDKVNKVIRKMAEENDLVGVITVADFNDEDKLGKGKEMVDRLSKLIAIFEDDALDFSSNQATDDDILGDAYEYLMRHFATESGKSKGQFYTPAEVSRVMAQIIGINENTTQDQTIYDPTAGSGSLLLKAADEAPRGLTIYGQEKDVSTVALAKMNMILHNNEIAEIAQGDTITSPAFIEDNELKRFDFAVSNPPFSAKSWSNGIDPENDIYGRFTGFGVPPAKKGDYAFFLHLLKSLKSTGKGAIILPHGVLFRGNVEAEIRKNVVKRGYIKGIIGLPANLFYGTGIPASIIVVDKENAHARKGIFLIDASEGFVKDGNKNRLREQDIRKIVDVFNNQIEIEGYSRMVPFAQIEANEYNLNIPRYIDKEEDEDYQDIEAHLLGGIPKRDIDNLDKFWKVFPTIKNVLFKETNRPGYSELNVKPEQINETILNHEEFASYKDQLYSVFNDWKSTYEPFLYDLNHESVPRRVINKLSEGMLKAFENIPLIDKYDMYQYIMSYWNETMKDDVYMIVENGWKANNELTPESLFISRYFSEEQEEINQLEAEIDQLEQEKVALVEENSDENGIFEDIKNDKGNITKGNLNKKLKEIKGDPDYVEDYQLLITYKELDEEIAKLKKGIKDKKFQLAIAIQKKYEEISEDELKDLVVKNKWMASLLESMNEELTRLSQRLTSRVEELAVRYKDPLPKLEEEYDNIIVKVEGHLQRMGFNW